MRFRWSQTVTPYDTLTSAIGYRRLANHPMSSKKRTSAQYERRDRAFLAHVALYRCGLYQSLSKVLFGESGKPIGTIASKLARCETPLVSINERSIPGGHNALTITPAGCRFLANVPAKRGAKPLQGAALDEAIAISFFCCLDTTRRYRIERFRDRVRRSRSILGANRRRDDTSRVLRHAASATHSLIRAGLGRRFGSATNQTYSTRAKRMRSRSRGDSRS